MAGRDPSAAARPAGVGRVVLRDQVKAILLERILSGDYAPGDRLVETRIAQELGTAVATRLSPAEVAELHRPILEALRRRDAGQAGKAIRRHVELFGKRLIEERGRHA